MLLAMVSSSLLLVGPLLVVIGWPIVSLVLVPVVAHGICVGSGQPDRRHHSTRAILLLPFKLVAGLVWTIYLVTSIVIVHASHVFRLLCMRHSARVKPHHAADEELHRVEGTDFNEQPVEPALDTLELGVKHRSRYSSFDSIWAALEGRQDADDPNSSPVQPGDVRLLSANWLMELAKRGGTLDRRQDLPEEAFLSATQLKAILAEARPRWHQGLISEHIGSVLRGKGFFGPICAMILALLGFRKERNVDNLLPIIAISYVWLEASHPDRDGRQLQLMRERLQKLYGGRGLLGACRDYGFADMGVFLDWASLYQKDPKQFDPKETPESKPEDERAAFIEDLKARRKFYGGERYEASRTDGGGSKEAFGRALHHTMDLWYAHAGITVVLLTRLPEGTDTARSYESRGWTTFERCSAELGKSFRLITAKWKLVIDTANDDGEVQRRLPTVPKRMEELLKSRHFTNGADKAAVLQLYTKTTSAVLETVEVLSFSGLPLVRSDEWCSPAGVADALNYCSALKKVELEGMRLDDEGLAELVGGLSDGALPALRRLWLNGNRFGAQGVTTVCDALGHRAVAPKLQLLGFVSTLLGDEGARAVAAAIRLGHIPGGVQQIHLVENDIGDEGAMSIASALLESGSRCRPLLLFNRIGLRGQLALLQALEARHGASLGNFSQVFLNAPTFLPAFLMRAFSRGIRRNFEVLGHEGLF